MLIDTANFYNVSSNSVTNSFTTGNVTVGAGDNMLVCFVEAYTDTVTEHFASVVWGGHALTYYGQVYNTGLIEIDVWYLANPTPGTATIVATASSTLQGFSALSAVPMSGVNVSAVPTSCFGSLATAFNTTGSPIAVTGTGLGSNGIYLGCAEISTSTVTQTNPNGTNLGSVSGIVLSTDWIPGVDSGAFTWTGTGGSDNTATAIVLPVIGTIAAGGGNQSLLTTGVALAPLAWVIRRRRIRARERNAELRQWKNFK